MATDIESLVNEHDGVAGGFFKVRFKPLNLFGWDVRVGPLKALAAVRLAVAAETRIQNNKVEAAGIEIARRTVAKYRESLHIPSSVQRRRQKSARI